MTYWQSLPHASRSSAMLRALKLYLWLNPTSRKSLSSHYAYYNKRLHKSVISKTAEITARFCHSLAMPRDYYSGNNGYQEL